MAEISISTSPSRQLYEYLVVTDIELENAQAVQDKLNELGAQGWSFIHADSYYHTPNVIRLWFIRAQVKAD